METPRRASGPISDTGQAEDAAAQGPGRFAVKRATREDLPQAAAVQAVCLREIGRGLMPDEALEDLTGPDTIHATIAGWNEIWDAGGKFWVIADRLNMKIVGVALTQISGADDAPVPRELSTLHVLPEARTCGASDALIDTALGDEPAYVWVFQDNPRAISFFRRHGFEVDEGSIDNSLGGIIMERMVRDPQA